MLTQLAHELATIERAGLAGYFLIVWDIMRFARGEGILCQGRGSAANSIVAYLLGITSIDPLRYALLFERFLSEDKFTMPDIDLDFQWDRREEVIQYVYRTYGAAYTAMVCNVNSYRARSALRDLGKALDFPPPVLDRLAKQLDTDSPKAAGAQLCAQIADAGPHHPLRQLAELLDQIEGCPRHLSIHSGGMLITSQPLDEVVPLARALGAAGYLAKPVRPTQFIQALDQAYALVAAEDSIAPTNSATVAATIAPLPSSRP